MEVKRLLQDRRGEVALSLSIIMLLALLFLAGLLQVHHVYVTIDQVKSKTNASVLAVAAANVPEVYGGARESVGTALHYADTGWASTVSTAAVLDALRTSLGATMAPDWSKLETASYSVSDLNTRYVNEENGNLNFITRLKLTIPLSIGQPLIPPITTILEVRTTYEPKF